MGGGAVPNDFAILLLMPRHGRLLADRVELVRFVRSVGSKNFVAIEHDLADPRANQVGRIRVRQNGNEK